MKINLVLSLLSFRLSKSEGYGLTLLNFGINTQRNAIGFNFYSKKNPNAINYMLVVYFYGFVKQFVIKTKKCEHFVCAYCGNPVWIHNFYCPECHDERMESEVIWVPLP